MKQIVAALLAISLLLIGCTTPADTRPALNQTQNYTLEEFNETTDNQTLPSIEDRLSSMNVPQNARVEVSESVFPTVEELGAINSNFLIQQNGAYTYALRVKEVTGREGWERSPSDYPLKRFSASGPWNQDLFAQTPFIEIYEFSDRDTAVEVYEIIKAKLYTNEYEVLLLKNVLGSSSFALSSVNASNSQMHSPDRSIIVTLRRNNAIVIMEARNIADYEQAYDEAVQIANLVDYKLAKTAAPAEST